MSKVKNNFKAKRWGKMLAFGLAILLACTTVVSVIGFASDGFKDRDPQSWFSHERNPDNLIQLENYKIKDGREDGNGIKFSVDEDGVIKLTGKATEDINVILADGKYTISGVKSCSDYSLVVTGANIDVKSGVTNDTFVLEQAATVTVSIYVKEGANFMFGKTIKPVLNKGDTPVDFYA